MVVNSKISLYLIEKHIVNLVGFAPNRSVSTKGELIHQHGCKCKLYRK